jgi:prophage DNA circulation protein
MQRPDAIEAEPIVNDALALLLGATNTQGRSGSDLRTAVGDFRANSRALLQNDQYGAPLLDIFQKAEAAGITWGQLESVRVQVSVATPLTLGAQLVQQTLIQLSLASEVSVIVATTFVSRDDVDAAQHAMNEAFIPAEELVADQNNSMVYLALIGLHSAMTAHLVATARPLPRMVDYEFFANYPTLVIAYKLYSDAGRADEVRAENKIVHPAFAPLAGRALAS